MKVLKRRFQSIAGWLPAIIFPTATLLQLIPVIQGRTEGVSVIAWTLFGVANLGAYISSTQKQTIQIILAFLFNSVLDLMIVTRCLLHL
ncbi:hypothetical protein LEP3755_29370 [Leptolyngbya sp. NIES-3755]|nr:hypothetical protein LEP3755_29370 [Leptolyngbya sp. NIES-3755]